MRRSPSSLGALVPFVLLLLGGCAHVAPYERESLSSRTMDVGESERYENSFLAHVHDSREAATGGASSTGGGCGCN